ncbi:alanine racemase [Candidatus Aminicenantes bacterium AC-334-K16]|nr:alanine racemase [Candidatus Aminicenantes bacterium AC-334-K16]
MKKAQREWLTWIELNEKAYAHNLAFFRRKITPKTELSVVVKANAYGHGLRPIVTLAEKYGVDSYCVHSLEEALELRTLGVKKDILIMGPIPPAGLQEAIVHNFRLALFSFQTLELLDELTRQRQKPIRVHLKLETGTYRLGINQKELQPFLARLQQTPFVRLEAAYTHFANIEDTTDHSYAFTQMARFKAMVKSIIKAGFPTIKLHTACSAALLLFPETHFNLVRLGISQYGLWPSRETFLSYKIKHTTNRENVLWPVLTWKTRIGQIKTVPAKETIGYGRTYQTSRLTRLAVLPVGYADGYDRRLSNQSYVLIRGRRAPVRGRVCMNLIMVDITDIEGADVGEEVVLLGSQGSETISAEALASLIGTINYEVVTRLNPHLPRIIVNTD